jgi:hypothetical protein
MLRGEVGDKPNNFLVVALFNFEIFDAISVLGDQT